jgi:hypothetical protein
MNKQHRALAIKHADTFADTRGRESFDFDNYGLAAYTVEVERAARAAALREAAEMCDGIERDRKAYSESAEIDEVESEHVLSQAIGAADCAIALRARAEGQSNG